MISQCPLPNAPTGKLKRHRGGFRYGCTSTQTKCTQDVI